MSPGQRFRARRKLTAALTRVAELITAMDKQGVAANRENYAAAITALKLLDRFLTGGPAAGDDPPIIVPADGRAAILRAVARRVKETGKRRVRRKH